MALSTLVRRKALKCCRIIWYCIFCLYLLPVDTSIEYFSSSMPNSFNVWIMFGDTIKIRQNRSIVTHHVDYDYIDIYQFWGHSGHSLLATQLSHTNCLLCPHRCLFDLGDNWYGLLLSGMSVDILTFLHSWLSLWVPFRSQSSQPFRSQSSQYRLTHRKV